MTYIGIIMTGITNVDTVLGMLLRLLARKGLVDRRAHISRAVSPLYTMWVQGGEVVGCEKGDA